MDNHGLPEEYETDTRDMPFLETPLGELCLVAAIAAWNTRADVRAPAILATQTNGGSYDPLCTHSR